MRARSSSLASAGLLLIVLSGCGGGGGSTGAPSTLPTPVPCTQNVVFQGSASGFPAHAADFETFTTTTTGRLDVTLDWTHSSSFMGVFVFQGPCSFTQFKAGACSYLLQMSSPPKPLKGSVASLPAGSYGLIVVNGSDAKESISTQLVLSSSSCPAAFSAAQRDAGDVIGSVADALTNELR